MTVSTGTLALSLALLPHPVFAVLTAAAPCDLRRIKKQSVKVLTLSREGLRAGGEEEGGRSVQRHAGKWEGVPVRAVPLINGCSARRALLGGRHVARRARDVVIRDNGWTHRLKCPIRGVAPARGSG